jgi:hypothetical protein
MMMTMISVGVGCARGGRNLFSFRKEACAVIFIVRRLGPNSPENLCRNSE